MDSFNTPTYEWFKYVTDGIKYVTVGFQILNSDKEFLRKRHVPADLITLPTDFEIQILKCISAGRGLYRRIQHAFFRGAVSAVMLPSEKAITVQIILII